MQRLIEMLPTLGSANDPNSLWDVLLACCLKHVVGNWLDRYEPRVLKRRPKPYKLMMKPRRGYQPGEA